MLEEIIKKGLTQLNQKGELGDRTKYVGSSDLSCERKAYLSKINPPNFSDENLMVFMRGNLTEEILKKILDNQKMNYTYQKEVIHPQKQHIKAHIDFLFQGKQEFGILEVKSTKHMPDEPYDTWINQIHYQMGLVALNNPDKKVKGAVIAFDISEGNYRIFNGFVYNQSFFNELEKIADKIWNALNNNDLKDLKPSPSFLCSYCHYRADCPAFLFYDDNAIDLNPISQSVFDYIEGKNMEKEGSNIADKNKAAIKNFMRNFTIGKLEDITVKFSQKNRNSLDTKRLALEHPDIYSLYKKETSYTQIDII
ncbi:MAG: Dna2/Cas4 domain-containing protein [Desulfobacterales bacterium]|nr:Dna2/Cas4 domain-containing protein [Desulfobacterales bacterium]